MSSVDSGAENGLIDFIWGLARLPGWDDRAGFLHVVNLHKGGRHVAEVSFLWQQEKRMYISLFVTSFDHQPSNCVCAEQWGDSLESSVLGGQQQEMVPYQYCPVFPQSNLCPCSLVLFHNESFLFKEQISCIIDPLI